MWSVGLVMFTSVTIWCFFHFSTAVGLQDAGSSGASVILAPSGVIEENGRVGLLLSSKALVQLVMNPVVGAVTARIGYHLPLFVGSINLLVASLCKITATSSGYTYSCLVQILCGTWSLILSEEHGLRLSEGRVLRIVYSVSHLTWNPSWQHAAATAASKLPGNEFFTMQRIAITCQ